MTNLFLEDKSFSFLTFPLVWKGGKKRKKELACSLGAQRQTFSLSELLPFPVSHHQAFLCFAYVAGLRSAVASQTTTSWPYLFFLVLLS